MITNLDKGVMVYGLADKTYSDLDIQGCRVGMDFQKSKNITVKNTKIVGGGRATTKPDGTPEKYAHGIRIGKGGDATYGNENLYFDGVTVDMLELPNSNYSLENKDCVTIERGNNGLYFKNCDFRNASDGVIDAKSDAEFLNCHFSNAYRVIRVWSGVTLKFSGCDMGGGKLWLDGLTASVIFHDTINNLTTQLENGATAAQVKIVTDNPLPQIPFFFPVDPLIAKINELDAENKKLWDRFALESSRISGLEGKLGQVKGIL
jgi:hypothetical protein